jgi:hypothetical protein
MNAPEVLKPREIAAEFLFGELIKAACKRFKSLSLPYMELKQSEQATLLRNIEDDVRDAVREAVEIIASDYRVVFRASCESVAFKADGVKSQLTMHNTEAAHALADAAGNTVLVVIEDGSRYLEVGDATKGEDNQKPLFDANAAA